MLCWFEAGSLEFADKKGFKLRQRSCNWTSGDIFYGVCQSAVVFGEFLKIVCEMNARTLQESVVYIGARVIAD